MVRLFSAIELPDPVRAELVQRLADVRAAETELRWVPPERWHITLGFYGDREHADRRGAWFRRQATGLAPARLRLRGAGRFPGVLWVGVSPMDGRDATALRIVADAMNADNNANRYDFAAHVTIARWRRGAAGSQSAIRAVHALSDYFGTWWSATEVVLFRSEQTGEEGPVYTPLDRVALASKQG
ncbi:MAG: RNA 2',3'-cyclic phosphodiesterase [Actinophytocola sp.]|uniref:RNA 2',3'-cyclic phosphodiesterase n=1 Tax=Actinophytocola sp. TaxID=1872138 RepID=UPI00132C6B12|nr:RNA 2',3'-cyclic phosphodiesterase [Actinophytocola sp.]MPZ81485.1 RNA 2',3'-cyclic phosphodiesterase [Actinophytocola sp.]